MDEGTITTTPPPPLPEATPLEGMAADQSQEAGDKDVGLASITEREGGGATDQLRQGMAASSTEEGGRSGEGSVAGSTLVSEGSQVLQCGAAVKKQERVSVSRW